jgi:hypothetical protein
MLRWNSRTSPKFAISVSSLLLFVIGLGLAVTQFLNGGESPVEVCLVLAAASLCVMIWSNREVPDWKFSDGIITSVAVSLAGVLAYTVAAIWPNSGDEYGYLYLADTLLQGRFYNPPPPAPGIFDFFHIAVHDGKSASQYAPGWPVFLSIFRALHIHRLANPALVGALGLLLSASLKRLEVKSETRLPLLAMALLCPFTLFNGASLFSHLLASVATVGICYLQIRDDLEPTFWSKAGIGTLLSVLLVTRHDSFLIVAAIFVIDRLVIRRLSALSDAVAFAVGGLPLSIAWLAYNWEVTGNPFLSTMLWGFPEEVQLRMFNRWVAFYYTVDMSSLLFAFAGVVPALLYALTLYLRLRRGLIRFYDLLLPGAILFYVFDPVDPGHQYGPRYWYFAWPSIVLTIGPELSAAGGAVRIIGRRLNLVSLTNKQLCLFAGFTIGFAVFLRMYIDERRSLYAVQVPETPAIILVPNWSFRVVPWQIEPFVVQARDFTRNGLDYDGEVLYARGDDSTFVKVACAMAGYHVFRWHGPGSLEKVNCAAE